VKRPLYQENLVEHRRFANSQLYCRRCGALEKHHIWLELKKRVVKKDESPFSVPKASKAAYFFSEIN
jgi:hypothetical protein